MSQLTPQSADDLRARKVELVLQQLDNLPTLPAIAVRLLNLAGNSETRIEQVVELISVDPALTSKVLALVGSAATGLRQNVTTVQQAVVMLGFEAIRNLILSVKVFEAFQKPSDSPDRRAFNRADFWKHSLAVATTAEMLAPRTCMRLSPHDAFVCGLLHDLGKVAFDAAMPKSFERVVEVATLTRGDIADAERRVIGLDHGVAGKRLAEAWNLPPLIAQTLWLHGAAPMSIPPGIINPGMIQLIGLADLLARRQHIGFSGNFLFPFEARQYLEPLGLTEQDLASVTERLAESLEQRARAIGLYEVQSRQLYLESIANANAELGRVNQTLQTQNRKLALRSECFDMLTQFYQRIIPTATPAQLLAEIAHVAHKFLGADRFVLFSQDPTQRAGEVLTFNAAATLHDSFLMPMPPAGGDQRAARPGNDFIRPATPQLDWLLDRVGLFFSNRRCLFLPLLCGPDPIGGILWPAQDTPAPVTDSADLLLVSRSWGITLRAAQVREQQNILTEALAGSNRQLASLQQQLVRAKSLANLGEMAAGAAHEMNNPLAVICGRAQLLANKLSDAPLKQDATLIAQQGQRLSQIITDLMEFARPQPPQRASVAIAQLVSDAVHEATQQAGPAAAGRIRLESTGDLPILQLDPAQIRRALAEIILNALQASPPSPPSTTATTATTATAPAPSPLSDVLVQIRHDPLDQQVVIQVSDHGTGMSEETMRQAFAPFFSVKQAGRQRGMGLAKALRWVEQHNGLIRLDSQLGLGTTVVIILPATDPSSEPQS